MNRMTRLALLVSAVLALTVAGCAKKAPAPAPAPPAPSSPATPAPTPTPTPSTPAPAPSTTGGTLTPEATIAKLQTVFFALDSYTLDDAARAVLDADAKLLREQAGVSIRIEGHCDERGTVEYNMSLGEKRAGAVRDYFVNAGVAESRLATISYGKERPAVEGHDETAWSRNRRAEFSKP